MTHWEYLLPCLLVLAACGTPTSDTIDNIEQRYLFEVEYVNHAWGLAWRGLVIDREGDIYAYNHSHEVWALAENESFTEAQLEDKYEHQLRYIGRINEATIVQQFGRIRSVGDDFSSPQHMCADAGGLTYRAFRYESASGTYRPLLLRVEGDFAQQNTANAAEELAAWLRSLVLSLEDVNVTPFSEGVCTP